jgi:putative DNA primase/helicase
MMRARELAERLLLKKYPRSWRGRCPCCAYPSDTFSVLAARDGTARLFCANGCNRDDLANAVMSATGQHVRSIESDVAGADVAARNLKRALAMWGGSEPAPDTLADRYLTGRGLPGLAASPALRYRADTPHPEGGRLPAMIALVVDVAGVPLGIHRTYLCRDGLKASVEPAKASLGPIWGGAIRLDPHKPHVPLIIGEGIESSASAGRLMALPAWAAVSAGNLAKGVVLPPEVRRVVIAADPDGAGRNASRDAWLRWKAEGRDVQIAQPHREGCDFNEMLVARRATHV